MRCNPGETLRRVNSSCCSSCVLCEKCSPLNYNICSYGFKPIKQNKTQNECCDTLTCISDPNHNEDLTLSIRENSDENTVHEHNYHTFSSTVSSSKGRSIFRTIKPVAFFNPSQKDAFTSNELQENEYSHESFDNNENDIEIYVDNYQGTFKMSLIIYLKYSVFYLIKKNRFFSKN